MTDEEWNREEKRRKIRGFLDALVPATATFVLRRTRDTTGVSGTGVVADGAMFPDGRTVTRWRDTRGVQQTCVWDNIGQVKEIHGHNGDTTIELVPVGELIRALAHVAALSNEDCEHACADWVLDEIAEALIEPDEAFRRAVAEVAGETGGPT